MRYAVDDIYGPGTQLAANEASNCPSCGVFMDGATPVDGVQVFPKPGDASLCANCFTPLKFGEDLELIALTEEELEGPYADVAQEFALARQIVRLKRGML